MENEIIESYLDRIANLEGEVRYIADELADLYESLKLEIDSCGGKPPTT